MHLCTRLATRSLFLCALLPLLLPVMAPAQPAFLVKDVNTSTFPTTSPFPEKMVAANGLVFFPLDDGIHGLELWRSDGTEAGTFLLADICLGSCSSQPSYLTPLGGAVYFSTGRSAIGGTLIGTALWKTDGTRAGTVKIIDLGLVDMAQVNGKLILSAFGQDNDNELWVSDGTAGGTMPMMDIFPGAESSNPIFLGQAGSSLFFRAQDPAHGRELWKTDGTPQGTALVKDLVPGSGSSFFDNPTNPRETYSPVGGRLFFPAVGAGGFLGRSGLWVTDGTEAGTYRINDLVPDSSWGLPLGMTGRNGDVFFYAYSDAGSVWELWKSDGTAAGTLRLKSGNLSIPPGSLRTLGVLGNAVFFPAIDEAGTEPWTTDGTPAGTTRFADLDPGPADGLNRNDLNAFMLVGSTLLFFANDGVHGTELWKSDGTAGGTSLVADLNPGPDGSFGFVARYPGDPGIVADNRWYFGASDASGWALWVSDGTTAGTQLVRRFPAQRPSIDLPPVMAPLAGSRLIFTAHPLGDSFPAELWRSDGTSAGTVKVSPDAAVPFLAIGPLNDLVIYGTSLGELWRTDGTAGGTRKIPGSPSYPVSIVQAGGRAFFTTYANDRAVWRTDGTSVSQIVVGQFSSWTHLTAFGDHLLFCSPSDSDVWISDGTPAGTAPVQGEADYSEPFHLTPAGDRFFFAAYTAQSGTELWVKEATSPLARQVKDINPGSNDGILPATQSLYFFDSTAFDNAPFAALHRNVLFPADDGVAGEELWASDGTAAGTVRLADINPGPLSSGIADLTAGRDRVWFTADDGLHGRELWMSDGTAAGTHMVRDIVPGSGSSHPQQLLAVGNALLFSAYDDAHGLELWRSDGTEAGTFLLQDIAPGTAPSSPQSFTLTDSYIFFTANDNVTGFEPWAIPRSALGFTLAATKTVSGQGSEGATITYTIVITNAGTGPSTDNPGDEMTDILPAGLILLDASADTGTAAVNLPANRVTWNGALPIGGTATVTIHAQVGAGAFPGVLLNQATLAYDTDGDGMSESAAVSDGPSPGAATPLNVSMAAVDFFTAAPCRVVDTRSSLPLASGVARTFNVAGTCGIPAGAKAVSANVTVVSPTGPGYVSVYPNGTAGGTSTVNFQTGQVRAGNAVLALKNGALDAKALVGGSGTVQLVIDVSGYFR